MANIGRWRMLLVPLLCLTILMLETNASSDNNQKQTLIQRLRHTLRSHPHILSRVDNIFNTFQGVPPGNRKSDDNWVCPGQGASVCSTSSVVSFGDGRSHGKNKWMTDAQRLADKFMLNDDECDTCMATASLLQTIACSSISWEAIRDVFIVECEQSFHDMGLDPVMCNGTVSLQGPHIYCILREGSPRDSCEAVNSCYPPDDRIRSPVSERTPWAMKASTEARKARETHRRNKPEDKNRRRDSLVMVAQLSDIHVQPEHAVGSSSECNADVCCLDTSIGNGSARLYGEYQCNIPQRTVDLFLNRVKQAKPDFVIYAGDSPPHTMWDETLISQLNCSQIVADSMWNAFGSSVEVYPTIGNHEMFPTNLFSLRMPETTNMTDGFTRMWHTLAGLDQQANSTMSELAYYTVRASYHTSLRIVSINTNYDWYTENFYNALNQYTPENSRHKQWLNDTLREARTAGDKVILIGHHAIGGSGVLIRTCRWWEELMQEYGDVIVLHTSGHAHEDMFTLSFNHDTMTATSVNQVAASTSSKRYVNPSMRMYYLDPSDGYSLVDIESFYLDIKTQDESRGVPPAIEFSYSARSLYDLPDLSPESWKELVFRLIDDDDLFLEFYQNINSRVEEQHCDHDCKALIICNIWFAEVSEAQECVTLAPTNVDHLYATGAGDGLASLLNRLTLLVVSLMMNMMFSDYHL